MKSGSQVRRDMHKNLLPCCLYNISTKADNLLRPDGHRVSPSWQPFSDRLIEGESQDETAQSAEVCLPLSTPSTGSAERKLLLLPSLTVVGLTS